MYAEAVERTDYEVIVEASGRILRSFELSLHYASFKPRQDLHSSRIFTAVFCQCFMVCRKIRYEREFGIRIPRIVVVGNSEGLYT